MQKYRIQLKRNQFKAADLTTHRITQWRAYLKVILEKPIGSIQIDLKK